MNELKITRTASVIDASTETVNAVYGIRYQIEEYDGIKNLLAVHVEIAKKQEDGTTMNIGNMDYNSEQISMSGFPYSDKTTTYMSEFAEIVEKIKETINKG